MEYFVNVCCVEYLYAKCALLSVFISFIQINYKIILFINNNTCSDTFSLKKCLNVKVKFDLLKKHFNCHFLPI